MDELSFPKDEKLTVAAAFKAAAATAEELVEELPPPPERLRGFCARLRPFQTDDEKTALSQVDRDAIEDGVADDADKEDLDLDFNNVNAQTVVTYARKPIERRTLRLPGSNRFRGKLEMWVDIMTREQAALHTPVDIRPAEALNFELRMVVWAVRGCPTADWVTNAADLFVSTSLNVVADGDREATVLKQETDTHWRSRSGRGHFNWRMVFGDLALPQPPSSPCRLSLNVWDQDPLLVSKELLGTAELDIRKLLFRKALFRHVEAQKKGALATKILAMSTKELRRELRQLGEHFDSSATRGELATALQFLLVGHDAGETRYPEGFSKPEAGHRCCRKYICCGSKRVTVDPEHPRSCVSVRRCYKKCCVSDAPARPVPTVWISLQPPRPSIHRKRKNIDVDGDGVYDLPSLEDETEEQIAAAANHASKGCMSCAKCAVLLVPCNRLLAAFAVCCCCCFLPTAKQSKRRLDDVPMAVEVSFEIIPTALATVQKVGLGRDGPNALEEPIERVTLEWTSPITSLKNILGPYLLRPIRNKIHQFITVF